MDGRTKKAALYQPIHHNVCLPTHHSYTMSTALLSYQPTITTPTTITDTTKNATSTNTPTNQIKKQI